MHHFKAQSADGSSLGSIMAVSSSFLQFLEDCVKIDAFSGVASLAPVEPPPPLLRPVFYFEYFLIYSKVTRMVQWIPL